LASSILFLFGKSVGYIPKIMQGLFRVIALPYTDL
jgi:hypothetical protein